MVSLVFVWQFGVYLGLCRIRLVWGSCKVLRFVEDSVNGSKHCKLQRISLRYASKGSFGTIFGQHKNAMRRR